MLSYRQLLACLFIYIYDIKQLYTGGNYIHRARKEDENESRTVGSNL